MQSALMKKSFQQSLATTVRLRVPQKKDQLNHLLKVLMKRLYLNKNNTLNQSKKLLKKEKVFSKLSSVTLKYQPMNRLRLKNYQSVKAIHSPRKLQRSKKLKR